MVESFQLTDFANNFFSRFSEITSAGVDLFSFSGGGRTPVLALDVDNLDNGPQSHRCQIV
jgi:hypothetical protein